VAFERIAEQKIREAISQGKFDDLARHGAIDLEEYFKLPAELRMAYSVLKSAGCVPQEVELLNEVAALDRELSRATDPEARRAASRALADARLRLALALERNAPARDLT
jgi:hypothetical protein